MKTKDAVTAFINSGKSLGKAKGTTRWYQIILGQFQQQYPVLPAKPEALEDFLGGLEVGDETRFDYYRALRAFYHWIEVRYGKTNPTRAMTAPHRRKKHPRTLSMLEAQQLFAVRLSPRDRALICLFLDTGVRVGEAVALRVEDILQETIVVNGKTGEHEVPITEDTRRQLLALATSGYVFKRGTGHISTVQAYRIVHDALVASGLSGRKLGPHLLRHTLGKLYIAAGGDLVSLQNIFGHSNIATTRIYVELNTTEIIRQHHKFSPIRAATAPVQGRLLDEAESLLRNVSREEK